MKKKYSIITALIGFLMLTVLFFSLPKELKVEQRKPYRLYQEEKYFGDYRLNMFFIKNEDEFIWYEGSMEREVFIFSFDDIKVISENNSISIQSENNEIGTCNLIFECSDSDLADEYSVDDLTDFAQISILYETEFPGIFNNINFGMFIIIQSLLYSLMLMFFRYGINGNDKLDDFLRFTSKYVDRVYWLNDENNAKWRVTAFHGISLILACTILIYLIYVLISVIML